jgi:cytochrome c biogenesis protein CcdA/thiol-disulfide isomerase/thioredoxin
MIVTILLSFVAGLLTALAPCVLPLLPVILGGSFDRSIRDKKRPYIITASLVVSLVLFTLVLKVSSALINIDPRVWTIGSGMLVVVLGVFMLFPQAWAYIIGRLGIESRAQKSLGSAYGQKSKLWSAVLIGAALGPVFSSCSPTYGWVLSTVIPNNIGLGMIYLVVYCLGVATSLLAIALLGQRLLKRVKWASNPHGVFQRSIAVIFILVGIFVATGIDKKIETWAVERDTFHLIRLEKKLVPSGSKSSKAQDSTPVAATKDTTKNESKFFNVAPYRAPEIVGAGEWFNTEPLTLAGLKGKVVLVDFWTYSCINCIRTLPYLQGWYDAYRDKGFVVIGVHAPEFAFEKIPKNLAGAIKEKSLTYPIVQDNNLATWATYKNQYWPATYLIDRDGNVRREHFGEGEYEVTEQAIRSLLSETSSDSVIKGTTEPPIDRNQTPETYLGYERGERFASASEFQPDTVVKYSGTPVPKSNQWVLSGSWKMGAKDTVASGIDSKLSIRFTGREVYLVMSGDGAAGSLVLNGTKVTASALGGSDTNDKGELIPAVPRLYRLIKSDTLIKDGLLEISLPAGTTINAFTFAG